MTLTNWLAVVGLILDILGVLVLFKYGLPSSVKEKGSAFGGTETKEAEIKRQANNRRIEIRAQAGLWLLIAGFLFQLASNLIPALPCRGCFLN